MPKKPSRALVLATAAADLAASKTDLGAWLRVCQALALAGKEAEAAGGFDRLGRAASDLGQVALAVGCARWLATHDRADEASALVDAIAETHCQGATRIDSGARPAPPPRRGTEPVAPDPRVTLAAAVKACDAAMAKAAAAAAERAPDKLPPTPLVRVLQPDDFRELVAVIELRAVDAGEVVVDVGQPARVLYWIARGAAQVSRDGVELGILSSGAFFGEIALVGGTTRTARVACSEPTWLLEIPAESIEKVASRAPRLAKVLAEYARARLLSNVTRTSELFGRLDDSERRLLLSRFSTQLVDAGHKLIERGKRNDTLFVLVSGRAEVRDADGKAMATVVPGDGVGEISLISGQPANADVVAIESLAVLGITRSAFDEVAVAHPGLLAEVYKLKLEREDENADVIHDADDLIV